MEDLWAFNEEVVARAIYACPIPVVSAVGHEIDVTIADLVADKRALTPSEAGEFVVPQRAEVLSDFAHLGGADSESAARDCLEAPAGRLLDALWAAAGQPARPFDIGCTIASDSSTNCHSGSAAECEGAERLRAASHATARTPVRSSRAALSPLKVLGRGYSLTRRESNGEIVRKADDLRVGERIETLLMEGRLGSLVERVDP